MTRAERLTWIARSIARQPCLDLHGDGNIEYDRNGKPVDRTKFSTIARKNLSARRMSERLYQRNKEVK